MLVTMHLCCVTAFSTSWCGGSSVTTQGHIWCFCWVNSAHYIAQVVKPVLLPFLRQEGDVLFQQDNACPHMAAAMQFAPRGVQQLPWPARAPDLSPNEHVWDMMKRELALYPEPTTTIAELQQWVQDAWNNLLQNDIQHLYDHLHV